MDAKPERLQKILAAAGLASRRKAEQLIEAGLVSVNGHTITEPGTKADPRLDEIRVDGKLLRGPERHVYLAIYKPKGHMTTVSDPEGRPTIMDLLKGVEERVFPVGRLDYMSEGLLLLTNDGELMEQLTRAGSHVAKTYMVKVSGKPAEEEIDKLRNGIMLPPEPGLTGVRGKKQPGVERRSFAILTQPATIQLAVDQENPWYEVTLTEGRNRQIRRMFEQIGYHIEKIKRVRYGSLTLDIEPGEFRHLTPKEVLQLRKSLDTPFKPKPLKAKRKDDRPDRRPRVDAARFVKGRRGKPSVDAPAPAPFVRRASATPTEFETRREYPAPREEGSERSNFTRPRGPEFAKDTRDEGGFAAKRTYPPKPASGYAAKPAGDFQDRPKRSYASKPSGSFDRKSGSSDRKPGSSDRKPGSFLRKPAGDSSKREVGYVKRAPEYTRPEGAASDAPEKRDTSNTGGFGFSKYNKPKFVKPSKHRDLGSDNTDNSALRPIPSDRPYSKERGASSDRGYAKKPGGSTSDRRYSKGPGKPGGYAPRSSTDAKRPSGDFKPRTGGDFKPGSGTSNDFRRPTGDFKRTGSSDFKRTGSGDFKRPGGDFKRSSEARPSGGGGFGKSFGADRPRTSPGAHGKPSGGGSFGAKRPGFGSPREGSGPRRPSGPPRRRPDGR